MIQLTLEQLVTVDRSVYELRTAAENALAHGRFNYAAELGALAEQLATLQLQLCGQPGSREPRLVPRLRGPYCDTCGARGGTHWAGCTARHS